MHFPQLPKFICPLVASGRRWHNRRRHLRPGGKAPQHDESGATTIEYGLIAVGISVATITVLNGVGTKLGSTFTSVQKCAELTGKLRHAWLHDPLRLGSRKILLEPFRLNGCAGTFAGSLAEGRSA